MSPTLDSPDGSDVGRRDGAPRVRRLLGLLVVAACAAPIFAHGCHRWDHDDEPAFAPPPPRVHQANVPR
jgi:hypothetical protein